MAAMKSAQLLLLVLPLTGVTSVAPYTWWGDGTGNYNEDNFWEPAYDEDYIEVYPPDMQSKLTMKYWADMGKGIACNKQQDSNVCRRYSDCGCRVVRFQGNIGSIQAQLSSSKESAQKCVDANPMTSCSSRGGEQTPWLLLDLKKRQPISSVTLYNVNKGGEKLKNVEVRISRRRPKLSSASMFRHGKVLGKYSGPGWNHQDIVFATGKNLRGRYIIVQKNDRSPLELLEVKVITPKCQKRWTRGTNYKDWVHTTKSGRNCQLWTKGHDKFNKGHNYCRNPSGHNKDAKGVWCYTTDPKVPWEHCRVPKC